MPPSGCSLAIGNCEINMRDSHELWHTGRPFAGKSTQHARQVDCTFRRRRGLGDFADCRRDGRYAAVQSSGVLHLESAVHRRSRTSCNWVVGRTRKDVTRGAYVTVYATARTTKQPKSQAVISTPRYLSCEDHRPSRQKLAVAGNFIAGDPVNSGCRCGAALRRIPAAAACTAATAAATPCQSLPRRPASQCEAAAPGRQANWPITQSGQAYSPCHRALDQRTETREAVHGLLRLA